MSRRPVFLNLLQIRQPVMAWASLLHRVSGVVLFLQLPLAVYLLEESLRNAEGYGAVQRLLTAPGGRLLLLLGCWALAHHLLAGVRVLLADVEIGLSLPAARQGAWWVVGGGAVAAVAAAVWLA